MSDRLRLAIIGDGKMGRAVHAVGSEYSMAAGAAGKTRGALQTHIDALLAAPMVTTLLGLRDRAMLEVLYATGLRVSELVSLEIAQVNTRQGVVRVTGKGAKERLVPLGEEALDWLARYVNEARGELCRGRPSNAMFPTQRGAAMTHDATIGYGIT